MSAKKRFLSLVLASTSLTFISSAGFAATEKCTLQTARQSVSTETLCACRVVEDRMLRYIQRRSDFEDILARTLDSCPAFAAVLTDFPTASVADPGNEGHGGEEGLISAASEPSTSVPGGSEASIR